MATQLKNVKFGQAVLCSKDTTNLQEFDLTHVNFSGGSFIRGHFLHGTSCGGTICGSYICGGSVTTDSFAFASCGGTFCGCGGRIDLGSGYLDNAIISSTCQLSGLTLDYPTVCGGSLYDVSIGGNSTYIYDANICGASLNNIINNYGTICGGSIADVTLGGSISNYGTINGGVVSSFTLCGLINNDGTISGGVISGSSLSYVSFTCGDTVSGNNATIGNIRLSGANFDNGYINGEIIVSGSGRFHLFDNTCIDFTSGGYLQMSGIRYMPQLSGNQLVFLQA